jgi:hypothetical protein
MSPPAIAAEYLVKRVKKMTTVFNVKRVKRVKKMKTVFHVKRATNDE